MFVGADVAIDEPGAATTNGEADQGGADAADEPEEGAAEESEQGSLKGHHDARRYRDEDVDEKQANPECGGGDASAFELFGGIDEEGNAQCFNHEETDGHEGRDDSGDDEETTNQGEATNREPGTRQAVMPRAGTISEHVLPLSLLTICVQRHECPGSPQQRHSCLFGA